MELTKKTWSEKNFCEFREWQKSLKGDDLNASWEQRIVNTKLDCLAKTSTKAKDAVKQIKKGNYISFLEGVEILSHFDSIVSAYLLNLINDSVIYERLLDKFVITIDNWASADSLKFGKFDKGFLIKLSNRYLLNDKEFVRRVGVNFWFEIIKDKKYLNDCFEMLNSLKKEQEYYVNMCGAWLLAECMAKYRDETLKYFNKNSTNSFIINKSISKCRDSFRISKEDKDLLLKFKIKTQKTVKNKLKICKK